MRTVRSYRFRVTKKDTGRVIAYTNVRAESVHDAKENLLHRLHVPPSKHGDNCPYILYLKRGGDYRKV